MGENICIFPGIYNTFLSECFLIFPLTFVGKIKKLSSKFIRAFINRIVRKEVIGLAEMAYCVKCRTKSEMADAQKVTMKNGRPAIKGKCSKCGTGMYKILSAK